MVNALSTAVWLDLTVTENSTYLSCHDDILEHNHDYCDHRRRDVEE